MDQLDLFAWGRAEPPRVPEAAPQAPEPFDPASLGDRELLARFAAATRADDRRLLIREIAARELKEAIPELLRLMRLLSARPRPRSSRSSAPSARSRRATRPPSSAASSSRASIAITSGARFSR